MKYRNDFSWWCDFFYYGRPLVGEKTDKPKKHFMISTESEHPAGIGMIPSPVGCLGVGVIGAILGLGRDMHRSSYSSKPEPIL